MAYEKIYVEVVVRFHADGGMRPLEIKWADGERYVVDRVKYVERAPSRTGALVCKRYTILISGFEKCLYYEEGRERWFVERKIS